MSSSGVCTANQNDGKQFHERPGIYPEERERDRDRQKEDMVREHMTSGKTIVFIRTGRSRRNSKRENSRARKETHEGISFFSYFRSRRIPRTPLVLGV
jgi:hypothetical protein